MLQRVNRSIALCLRQMYGNRLLHVPEVTVCPLDLVNQYRIRILYAVCTAFDHEVIGICMDGVAK